MKSLSNSIAPPSFSFQRGLASFPLFAALGVSVLGTTLQAKSELAGRPATILLITSAELAESWQPFADWKTRQGKSTRIITTDTISKKYKGADIQQRIRACALDHIDTSGTRWIILGGDSKPGANGHVPHRTTSHPILGRGGMRFPGSKMPCGDERIATDLYYLSPADKNWDANNNGVYGEFPEDLEAIAYTHSSGAVIGRIPVKTVEDVVNYTEKVKGYESNYPIKGFAGKFLYTNTTDGSQPKVIRSWDDVISKAWPEGEVYRFFHTQTPWDGDGAPGSYTLGADHWVEKINSRIASKMHMHGHGMPEFWVLEHRTGDTHVDPKVVAKLTNENAYPIITTVSCFTGQFDTEADPCIAETMLRAPKRGAILMVAPSRSGIPIFHNPREDFPKMIKEGKLDATTESMSRFWAAGLESLDDGKYRTAGEAFASVKAHFSGDAAKNSSYHMLQCELNLLGDPTLYMRAKDPVVPEVKAPSSLTVAENAIEIRTAPNATVCLWKEDEVYAVTTANAKGVASFEVTPKSSGVMLLTVSGPHLNTVSLEIDVKDAE